MYAEVAVNAPQVEGTFHYFIPAKLAGKLEPGHLVEVPFGKRVMQGVVVAISVDSPVSETRPVARLINAKPIVTPLQLELAVWLSREHHTPLTNAIQLMIPPGITRKSDVLVTLVDPGGDANTNTQKRLIALLEKRGPLRGRQISHAMPGVRWKSAAAQLERRGVIAREPVLEAPKVKPKTERTLRLTGAPFPDSLTDQQRAVLDLLSEEAVFWEDIRGAADAIYSNPLSALRRLEEKGLVAFKDVEVVRDPLAAYSFPPKIAPKLTPAQAAIWEEIRAAMDGEARAKPFLIHGVTGSGKTEIYMRALDHALERGQRGLILVPEISLTPQAVRRFMARFPDRVAVWHSALSLGERYDTWRRVRAGEIDVVIGTRSAIFAPLGDLGVIVLDEEHDPSYKQSPGVVGPPYYHTRDVANWLSERTGAVVLLGSATPALESRFYAQRGDYHLLKLPERVMGYRFQVETLANRLGIGDVAYRPSDESEDAMTIDLPPVRVVDMRQELRAGERSMFSRPLQSAMEAVLARDEQAILFLNRRGTSTFVICRDCGYIAECPRCDLPLTWHGPRARLICHHCGYTVRQPESCPECGSGRIRYFGAGTEAVEAAVQERFPGAKTLRWDRDTVKRREDHAAILEAFIRREANVLIGTQMIAKGLDLPLVTLVGVVSADVGLGLPDFRAPERVFQVLMQVAGRAGRGLLGGEVIMQTYKPEHYAITAAAAHDYATFFAQEIANRRALHYPPFRKLVRVLFSDRKEAEARKMAESAARTLREHLPDPDLIGPAPCFFGRIGGYYRWHVFLRSVDPMRDLEEVFADSPPPRGWVIEPDPVDML
jgi:primosomal protein N' (replication factor Y)